MSTFKCLSLEQVDGVACAMSANEMSGLSEELLSLADLQPPLVVLSFKGVRFLSSAAINKLVVVERRIKARQGALILSDMETVLRELFRIFNLDSHFVIRDDRAAALAELLPARK